MLLHCGCIVCEVHAAWGVIQDSKVFLALMIKQLTYVYL